MHFLYEKTPSSPALPRFSYLLDPPIPTDPPAFPDIELSPQSQFELQQFNASLKTHYGRAGLLPHNLTWTQWETPSYGTPHLQDLAFLAPCEGVTTELALHPSQLSLPNQSTRALITDLAITTSVSTFDRTNSLLHFPSYLFLPELAGSEEYVSLSQNLLCQFARVVSGCPAPEVDLVRQLPWQRDDYHSWATQVGPDSTPPNYHSLYFILSAFQAAVSDHPSNGQYTMSDLMTYDFSQSSALDTLSQLMAAPNDQDPSNRHRSRTTMVQVDDILLFDRDSGINLTLSQSLNRVVNLVKRHHAKEIGVLNQDITSLLNFLYPFLDDTNHALVRNIFASWLEYCFDRTSPDQIMTLES